MEKSEEQEKATGTTIQHNLIITVNRKIWIKTIKENPNEDKHVRDFLLKEDIVLRAFYLLITRRPMVLCINQRVSILVYVFVYSCLSFSENIWCIESSEEVEKWNKRLEVSQEKRKKNCEKEEQPKTRRRKKVIRALYNIHFLVKR